MMDGECEACGTPDFPRCGTCGSPDVATFIKQSFATMRAQALQAEGTPEAKAMHFLSISFELFMLEQIKPMSVAEHHEEWKHRAGDVR